MVRIEVDDNKIHVNFAGGPDDVAVDLATAVSQMHCTFYAVEPDRVLAFRRCVEILLGTNSPVWDTDRDVTVITAPMREEQNDHS